MDEKKDESKDETIRIDGPTAEDAPDAKRKRIRMGLGITARDVEEHMKRHPRAMEMLE